MTAFRPFSRLVGGLEPAEPLRAHTSDGVGLSVLRLRERGDKGAVILLHGLAGGAASFHFPQRSLARYLARQGYDCFVPELRGTGESDAPARSWDMHDHLDFDLPAIMELAQSYSGFERVHFIGHSMGGVLLLLYGIAHPDAPIARAVTVASALDYTPGDSAFRRLLFLRPFLERLRFTLPYGSFCHLVSPLCGTPLTRAFESFSVCRANIEVETVRRLHALAFNTISVPLLVSLASTFEPGGFVSRDGSLAYLAAARRFRAPTLLVGGNVDAQCPASAVAATALALGSTDHELAMFGKGHGHEEDYGHWDLIIGTRAEREVWPRISGWLDKS